MSINTNILILSHDNDAHISFVARHLKQQPLLVDPSDVVFGDTIDYRVANNKSDVLYKGQLLNSVAAIWFRRPTSLNKSLLPVSEADNEHSASAISHHVEMFLQAFPDAYWISNVANIRMAESKVYQLRVAKKVGFLIPDTLFASNGNIAKEFVAKHKICIAKSQATSFPKGKLAFSKIIRSSDNLKYTNLYLSPYTFQQYIEPVYELRVTVVQDKVFAAKVGGEAIDGKTSEFRDWRYAYVNKSFMAEAVDLTPKLQNQCIQLIKDLGLQFGAIDLIVDKHNKTWFLEINPNGQWAFIEEVTKQPIGFTIARALERETK